MRCRYLLALLSGLSVVYMLTAQQVEHVDEKAVFERSCDEPEAHESEDDEAIISDTTPYTELAMEYGDMLFKLSGKFVPEMFYASNQALLNNCIDADRVWYMRHTADLVVHALYGKKKYGYDAARFKMTLRNKGRWGNTASIVDTSSEPIRLLDASVGSHRHSIPRHVFWMREAWLELSLNALADSVRDSKHLLTMGLFPFQLGRGISLGAAYATNPGLLGFYNDRAIDQFAPGVSLGGLIAHDRLHYDAYVGILQNFSDSFGQTTAKVFSQECGRRNCPQRGFGNINFVVAGRLIGTIIDRGDDEKVTIEPYIMFNRDPEQRVEFAADAESKLGTYGMAFDYINGRFGFSLEAAGNFGRQFVRCWDRNIIEVENRDGHLVFVNSHVLDKDGKKVLHDPKSPNGEKIQSAINGVDQCDACSVNGQNIVVELDNKMTTTLTNAKDRIRPSYTNDYKGWMVVGDFGYQAYDSVLLTAGAGAASGDDNPNRNLDDPNASVMDGDYRGFLGLQEIYSGGSRLQSYYVLGKKLPRPLSTPTVDFNQDIFEDSVSEFTNIIYAGAGIHIHPVDYDKTLYVKSYLLAFWQEKPTFKFDRKKLVSTRSRARSHLGLEWNVFSEWFPMSCTRVFGVFSVFIPGKHFCDISGRPLSAAQARLLDKKDKTGYNKDPIQVLGNDVVASINVGVEFRF